MTYEEALYYLKTIPIGEVGYTYEPIKVDVLGCAIDAIEKALEKQAITEITNDKYRWHDLRKNPNDLPKIDDMVLVCFEWKGKFSGDIYTDYVTSYHNGILFDGFQIDGLYKVIAWREIEPFEVAE